MGIRRSGPWPAIAALLVGTVAVFGSLEREARTTAATLELDRPFWYGAARQQVAHAPVDVLVLGSSRVAYAVAEERLSALLSARLGRTVTVIDLGMGYTTWAEHALGLQRLVETSPANTHGAIVLIEAPSGRVPLGSWRQWYHPFSPGLLRQVFRGSDLGMLWQSPELFDRKVAATVDWYGAGSALLRHRRQLREHVTGLLTARLFGERPPETRTGTIGGGRPGANLGNTRLRMVLQGIGLGRTASPGEPAPTETLVDTAWRAGMRPVLLFVPEYPGRLDYGGYAEEQHRPGQGRLGHVTMLHPEAHPTPEDFFDGVHLNPAMVERYTDALAALLPDLLSKGDGLRR